MPESSKSSEERPVSSGQRKSGTDAGAASETRKRSRSRKALFYGAGALGGIALIAILAIVVLYQAGSVDRYVEKGFVAAFDDMKIVFEADAFRVNAFPLYIDVKGAKFTNKITGAELGDLSHGRFNLTVLDLFAFSTDRHVHIDEALIDGLTVRFNVAEGGESNFTGVEFLPPKNFVKFEYSSSRVTVRKSSVRFGDESKSISGEANNIRFSLTPVTGKRKKGQPRYRYELRADDAEFAYAERKLRPVDVSSSGILDDEGAQVSDLTVDSDLGKTAFSGTVTSWSPITYDLHTDASIDLARAARIFPLGSVLSGTGIFAGRVSGKGADYQVNGEIRSESLAADNVSLRSLRIESDLGGSGSTYRARGKAIAELLTFGEFRVDYPQLIGNIRGTGSDFGWFGELQAAALSSPLGTIGGLYLNDALAEYKDRRLSADLRNVRARKFTSSSALAETIKVPRILIRTKDGRTSATVDSSSAENVTVDEAKLSGVKVGRMEVTTGPQRTDVTASRVTADSLNSGETSLNDLEANEIRSVTQNGVTRMTAGSIRSDSTRVGSARISGVTASDVTAETAGGSTSIGIPKLALAAVDTDAAILGSLNISGVRLTVREGRIEGEAEDFNVGPVDLRKNGRLDDLSVKRPVFLVEPSGRYRASLDMTLGSGLLGSFELGAASASVTADNDKIAFTDLKAEVMEGRIDGEASLALTELSPSELKVDFTGLDLTKLFVIEGGDVLPIDGTISGRADLAFSANDFRRASGKITANVAASAGDDRNGSIPVKGVISAKADDGLFAIEKVQLASNATEVAASGKFDLFRSGSDLNLAVNSTDASEVERVLKVMKLAPELESQMAYYEGHLAGDFTFEGRFTGNIREPLINGQTTVGSVALRGRDLGTLNSDLSVTPEGVELRRGTLRESGGGMVLFGINIPNSGPNRTTVRATLRGYDIGKLLTALPIESLPESFRDLQAETNGSLELEGLPDEMRGTARLAAGRGTLRGQTFDRLDSSFRFEGTLVRIEKLNAGFGSGTFELVGSYDTNTTAFDFRTNARALPVVRIMPFLPSDPRIPEAEGTIDLDASVSGRRNDTGSYAIAFGGRGRGIRLNGKRFGDIEYDGRTKDGYLTAKFSTHLGGRPQTISATVDFSKEEVPMTASTRLIDTPLGPYIALFRRPDPERVSVDGRASGEINVAGDLTKTDGENRRSFTTDNLRGTAEFGQFSLLIGEAPLNATEEIKLSFSFKEVSVDNARFSGGGSNLVVDGTKALAEGGINDLSIDGRINLRVLNAISRNIFFSGLSDVEVTLKGPNSTARLNGRSHLKRGSVATFVGTERVTLERLEGCLLFNTSQVQIGCRETGRGSGEITGKLGGGNVRLGGEVLLGQDLRVKHFRLKFDGKDVRAPLPTDFMTTGNANLKLLGKRDDDNEFTTIVSGTVFARKSVYTNDIDLADFVSGRREASLAKSDAGGSIFGNTTLDIRVLGRDALVVRNNIADLTASADLRVTGDLQSPQVSGRITATRGLVFFRNDSYDVQRGSLTFPLNTLIDPVIDLQAETRISGYQIFVTLSGNLADTQSLAASVRSNPSLPPVDVVSLITTGSLANTGTGIPTYAQSGLNTAAEILTDEIVNKPVTRATDKLFGLNKFNLDPIVTGQRGNPTARLTVGRQVNRNLLVTFSTDLSEEQNRVLALEYRLSNRLSVLAQYKQRPLSNVTRRRNSFNIEVRLRKRF